MTDPANLTSPTQLRDGSTTLDPRLDRLTQFDERSRAYNIATLMGSAEPRSYTWPCRVRDLDQGSEGACVGFAWTAELLASPKVVPGLHNPDALAVYRRAQQIDPWPGEAYSGTSVLAGAQAVQEQGRLKEYRWAFSTDDLAVAVSRKGPAVLGIAWYNSMYNPGPDGFLRPAGTVVGGHAILCVGYNVRGRYFVLQNSWGRDWGTDARARISYEDLHGLLQAGGEACIPVYRS